jgi:hypothetical protein
MPASQELTAENCDWQLEFSSAWELAAEGSGSQIQWLE